MARIKTGIHGFDEKIKGGFPEASAILISGPPKCGKTIFSAQFFHAGLEQEEPGVYAITGMPLGQLKQMMREFGLSPTPYEERGFVFYIDLFSIRSGSAEDTETVRNVLPENMTGFMIACTDANRYLAPKAMRMRMMVDGLTDFLEVNPSALKRVSKTLIARNKRANVTTLMTYTEGTADDTTEAIFRSMVDGSIHLDGNGTLVVESMPMTPCPIEAKYEITGEGIVVR